MASERRGTKRAAVETNDDEATLPRLHTPKDQEVQPNEEEERKEQTSSAKLIQVYAEKGGVGKTSTTLALGKSLAKAGRRVLLVDLDSQSSLTRLCLLPKFSGSADDIKKTYLALIKGRSVHDVFDKVIRGQPIRDFPDPLRVGEDNLWIVPGESDTSNLDFHLALAQGLYPYMPYALNYWGAVRAIIEQMASRVKADYAIIDCNPSSSMLNRIVMFSSDFWLPVLMPDFLSEQPIDVMADRLTKPSSISFLTQKDWVEEARALGELTREKALYPFRGQPPCYVGTVINKSAGDTDNPYEASIVNRLESFVKILESKGFKCLSAVAARIPTVKSSDAFPLFADSTVIKIFDSLAQRILHG